MHCSSTTLVMPSETEELIHKTCDSYGYCRGPSLGHTYKISVRDQTIVGCVLGGAAIIAVVVLAIWCRKRRKMEMKNRQDRKGKEVMKEKLRRDPPGLGSRMERLLVDEDQVGM
ncbi:hypothetical protein F4782DRAFT_531417 [Xylaria castorea]|nr:hypothetical protein F4782DRAFT_531417 [Xylaria castorea]